MDFLEINGGGSSSNGIRSTFTRSISIGQEVVELNKIIEQCRSMSIQIIQLPDKRLENGLNLLAFKAKQKNSKETIIVFVTRFNLDKISITAYFNGKKVQKAQVANQHQISKLIKKWTDSSKLKNEDLQTKAMKIIQKLNEKCAQLAKSQKNELVGIQKLKTTSQYRRLIEYQIQLSMQIQSLSDSLIKQQSNMESQRQHILVKTSEIQQLKDQIQNFQYEYEQACRYLRNAKQHLNQHLQIKKSKFENLRISNENQLNDFILEAKKLKKIELQKRFLL